MKPEYLISILRQAARTGNDVNTARTLTHLADTLQADLDREKAGRRAGWR